MIKAYDLIVSGYSSFDHMITLKSDVVIGKTSLIENASCSNVYWGGCSVNVAVALQRLGMRAVPVLRVGDDFVSSGFKDFLLDEGIDLETITIVEGDVNSTSFMLQMPDGEHITTFYPGAMDEKYATSLPLEWFEKSRAALITVASHVDNGLFLSRAKEAGIPIYFGMKGDPDAFPPDLLTEILLSSRIIFMNETESAQIQSLYGYTGITDIFRAGHADVIVVTKGGRGATYYTAEGESNTVPSRRVERIVSTTGGGDAFISGFLFGLNQGASYDLCCRYGATVSSFALETEGCITNLPTRAQLIARMETED